MATETAELIEEPEIERGLVQHAEAQVVVYKPLSASDVVAHADLINQVMKEVMKPEIHYGVIKGCGTKPTLFKAGAEKLSLTFHLKPKYSVQESRADGHIRFTIVTSLYGPNGEFMGEGVGEGSTAEDKYAWRKAVSPAEFDACPEDKRRIKYYASNSVQQVRNNPADMANTVLKMAKKRSLVDAIITACAASDILTQDLEDMAPEVRGGGADDILDDAPAPIKTKVEPKPQEPLISQDAIKRIRDLLDDTGEDIRPVLAKAKVDGLEMLTESQGNKTLAWLAKKKMEA